MGKHREYTDKDIIEGVAQVTSMAQLLRHLKLKVTGGSHALIKNKVKMLGLDCSHWKGQNWNKGLFLKHIDEYNRASNAKPHLICVRGHKCESCGNEQWMGQKIPIELHHLDGNTKNNKSDNLQLLCCNCHGLTISWRRKKSE